MIQTTATIFPPAKGLDFVSAPVAESQLYADGWRFALLYICRPQDTHMAKVATPERVARLHAAGIAVLLNYEAGGVESSQGAAKGAADGAWARDFAIRIGYPFGLPIMCSSFDTDVRGFIDTAAAYGEAFAANLGPYRLGVYGGTPIISRLAGRQPVGWKAMASAWSPFGFFPSIHIKQTGRVYPRADGTFGADTNTCMAPFEAWLPHEVPDPAPDQLPPAAPTHQEYDMSTLVALDAPSRFYDSRDPAGPNRMRANVPRDIAIGHDDATTAVFHCEAVNAAGPGRLVFWKGDTPAPAVTSVGWVTGNYGAELVTAPVTNGQVHVQSTVDCDLVCDLNWYFT